MGLIEHNVESAQLLGRVGMLEIVCGEKVVGTAQERLHQLRKLLGAFSWGKGVNSQFTGPRPVRPISNEGSETLCHFLANFLRQC